MYKKILTLGSLITVTAPLFSIVACSNNNTETNIQTQKNRWIDRLTYSNTITDNEKNTLIDKVNKANDQTQLNSVGATIASMLGMNWTPEHKAGSTSTNGNPVLDWDKIKPTSDDFFTYDAKTHTINANLKNADKNAVSKWSKLYDVYYFLVSEAKNNIVFTITDRSKTGSYITYTDKSKNGMPSAIWEHFLTIIEDNGNRGSISDLIMG